MTAVTFDSASWKKRLVKRAAACNVELPPSTTELLVSHALSVQRDNEELHLTSIADPHVFLERHLGEAFEGAAMISPDVRGPALDLGSGNGYPGLPLAAVRPGLQMLLVEASPRKAAFLRRVLTDCNLESAEVLEAQIQRAGDLFDLGPFRLIVSRAMGGWEKIVPRLVPALAADGEILLWSGDEPERVSSRSAWRKLRIVERRALPGRERSWIWRLAPNPLS